MLTRLRVLLLAAAVIVLSAPTALAQMQVVRAGSIADLRGELAPGDRVTVTEASGDQEQRYTAANGVLLPAPTYAGVRQGRTPRTTRERGAGWRSGSTRRSRSSRAACPSSHARYEFKGSWFRVGAGVQWTF
jgi:hypothetical protein